MERHAGARSSAGSVSGNASREGLVSGPVSRPRGVAKARERKRGEETDGAVLAFRPFRWASLRAKKGHVASFAPFATNVLSSGGAFDGIVPGRTFEESFTSSARAASLEGSTTAVATVRASSQCRFARPDEKRAGVLIPESARARLRGSSPRCGARARERVAAGTRMAYASVEVIVGRWGREQCSAKAFGLRPMETCERRLARALARFFVFRLFRRRSA